MDWLQGVRRTLDARGKAKGNGALLAVGLLVSGLSLGVFAVDMPLYYTYQNQLQTAVDAAALAGAAALPHGEQGAEDAIYDIAFENKVAGEPVLSEQLTINELNSETHTVEVTGEVMAPTMIGRFLCGVSGSAELPEEEGSENNGLDGAGSNSCDYMKVVAHAKAKPAARDTMLVVDNSSSMRSLGNNRPMRDVQDAAIDYVDLVAEFDNESVDRIGVVTFAFDSTLVEPLTSSNDDSDFHGVRTSVDTLSTYQGSGWNTNFEAGLREALDEMEANGRPNANKVIIFMTDGYPNLPGPPSHYQYSSSAPYMKCINMVQYSSLVRSLCYQYRRRWYCPYLPSSRITYDHIPDDGYQCALDYTGYLEQSVKDQVDRAERMGVTIHTVNIYQGGSNSQAVLGRMIKNDDWDPQLLEYMTDTTEGEGYTANNYDSDAISDIYQTIATDIRVKLTN